MKTFTKAIAVTTLTLSSIGMANASNVIVPADSYVTTQLCMTASEGNKAKLSKAIRKSGLTKHFITKNVKCNELNFTNFVEQYGTNVEQINNYLTGGHYSGNVEVENVASL